MRAELAAETKADTEADTNTDAILDAEREPKADTVLAPNIGTETDVRTNTELKRVGNIELYTKAAAEFGVAPGADLTIVAAKGPGINNKNVDTVCARERSSVCRKRMYNSTSKID